MDNAFVPQALFAWSNHAPTGDLSVHLFRRTFTVEQPGPTRRIAVTADSRYVLWLNGQRLGRGPLKGTLDHYHTETYDLGPTLRKGRNVLAAEVRWFGRSAPKSEVHSDQPGWWVQGLDDAELDTPGAWRTVHDTSVLPGWDDPFNFTQKWLGPLDCVDFRQRPRDWQAIDFDDGNWEPALAVEPMPPVTNVWGEPPLRSLHPRDIPQLREAPAQDFDRCLLDRKPTNLPWTVPAGTTGELWLEVAALTTSYPQFEFSGGAGREVRITYAEALGRWTGQPGASHWAKLPRRDDLEQGTLHGYRDVLQLSGEGDSFEPFHWRTFRYLKLEVSAGDSAVTLTSAQHRFTTFPQDFSARFRCDEPDLEPMWRISLHTLRACAHETYEDCPYYEQLNYVADTRLQALCSHYLANETRLGRRCLRLFHNSLGSDGLTACRAPASGRQVIPAFSLHWILMLHDHWMWEGTKDRHFVATSLPAAEAILRHFRTRLLPNGFVGGGQRWDWADWVPDWPVGVAPAVEAGTGSTLLTALFLKAINATIALHYGAGYPADASPWLALSQELRTTLAQAWDEGAGYFNEGPDRDADPFSQHVQAMVILAGGATPAQIARIGTRLVDDPALVPMSLFHRFYLAEALAVVGRFDRFFPAVLAPWRTMLANGLTTWPEAVDPSRSDCHAWSSWMVATFFSTILGIRPAAPGWQTIRIAPQFLASTSAEGSMQCPTGEIKVAWAVSGEQVELHIDAPVGIPVQVAFPGLPDAHYPAGGSLRLEGPRQAT